MKKVSVDILFHQFVHQCPAGRMAAGHLIIGNWMLFFTYLLFGHTRKWCLILPMWPCYLCHLWRVPDYVPIIPVKKLLLLRPLCEYWIMFTPHINSRGCAQATHQTDAEYAKQPSCVRVINRKHGLMSYIGKTIGHLLISIIKLHQINDSVFWKERKKYRTYFSVSKLLLSNMH